MNRFASIQAATRLVVSGLLISAALSLAPRVQAADSPETKSALESDPQGWIDILPPADLKGWYRTPVPPTGKLGRDQWHLDADRKVLICDGDGGHDMLLLDRAPPPREHFEKPKGSPILNAK